MDSGPLPSEEANLLDAHKPHSKKGGTTIEPLWQDMDLEAEDTDNSTLPVGYGCIQGG